MSLTPAQMAFIQTYILENIALQKMQKARTSELEAMAKSGKGKVEDITRVLEEADALRKEAVKLDAGLKEALRLLPETKGEVDAAKQTVADTTHTDDLAPARDALQTLKATVEAGAQQGRLLTSALETLERRKESVKTMNAAAKERLGGDLPQAMKDDFATTDKLLDVANEIDPEKVLKAVDDSDTPLEAIETSMNTLASARAAWLTALGLFQVRLTHLGTHKQAAEPSVASALQTITQGVTAASEQAKTHNYEGAAKALADLENTLLETENHADDCAHYKAILADRATRVGDLKNPSNHDAVKVRIEAAQKALADGKKLAEADKPDYTGAVALLTPLAKECIDVAWLSNRAERYEKLRVDVQGYITAREKRKDHIDLVKRLLDKLQALYDGSDYALTKDILKSTSLLEQGNSIDNELYDATEAYSDCVIKYNTANTAAKDLKAHKGYDAIKAEVAIMGRDLAFSLEKARAGFFPTSIKIAEKISADAVTLKKIADDYLAFLTAEKALKDERDKLDTSWDEFVAGLLDQVTKLEAEATTAKSAKEYLHAKEMLETALPIMQRAVAEAKNFGEIDKLTEDLKTGADSFDTETDKIMNEFAALKQKLEGADVDNFFADKILKADERATAARASGEKKPADWDTAKTEIKGAISDAFEIFEDIVDYNNAKQGHEALASDLANLKSVNRGDALEDEVDEVQDAIDEAKDATDDENYDAAQSHVAKGRATLARAIAKGKVFDEYKALRDGAIKTIRAKIWVTTADESIQKEVDKWEDDRVKAEQLGDDNKNFADALKQLKDLEKKGTAYAALLTDYKEAKERRTDYVEANLVWAKDRPIVAGHWTKAEDMRKTLAKMFKERQFKEAFNYAVDIYMVLKEADDIYNADEAFKVERAKAVTAIDDLKAVTCKPVEDTIKAAEEKLLAADQEVIALVYPNAQKLVTSIPDFCKDALQIGKDAQAYAPSYKDAGDAITRLRDSFGTDDAVMLELQVLQAQMETAKTLADSGDFKEAQKITDGLPALVDAIEKRAGAASGLATAAESAKQAQADDPTGLDDQIKAARQAHLALGSHAGASAIAESLARIETALSDAESNQDSDIPASRAALVRASADLVKANSEAESWVSADAAIKAAVATTERIRTAYPQPVALQQRLDTIAKELGLAREASARAEFSSAVNMVLSADATLKELEALGRAHKVYETDKAAREKSVADLAKHAGRYAVKDPLAEVRALIFTATTSAEALDYPKATKALAEAEAILQIAEIKADMTTSETLDEKKIVALLKQKGGDKKLDAIIKTLDPQTQRKAVHKALELRFDLKLEQYSDKDGSVADTSDTAPAPNIMRLYNLMDGLPEKHTVGNPSMALVKRIGEDLGTSSFSPSSKELKLRIGRALDNNEKLIGLPNELAPIDDDSVQKGTEKPDAFSWTTLHEIGHAVDDKLGYMDKNGHNADHGGWKVHAGNVKEIAQAASAVGAYNYNAAYIEAYLSNPGGNLLYPEPEGGATQEDWDRRRITVESWCDSIRVGKAIWNSASASSQAAIGGRVYQQSYDWEWVSYDLSARSKGVRGYQFRAPGEWFAELYAALHTDKLNDGHPARTLFKGL